MMERIITWNVPKEKSELAKKAIEALPEQTTDHKEINVYMSKDTNFEDYNKMIPN